MSIYCGIPTVGCDGYQKVIISYKLCRAISPEKIAEVFIPNFSSYDNVFFDTNISNKDFLFYTTAPVSFIHDYIKKNKGQWYYQHTEFDTERTPFFITKITVDEQPLFY